MILASKFTETCNTCRARNNLIVYCLCYPAMELQGLQSRVLGMNVPGHGSGGLQSAC